MVAMLDQQQGQADTVATVTQPKKAQVENKDTNNSYIAGIVVVPADVVVIPIIIVEKNACIHAWTLSNNTD